VLLYCAGEKGNISEATASILVTQRTLRRVAQNMVKRVNACIQENGGYFQPFYELYFRSYYIVALRSETSVAFLNEHPMCRFSPRKLTVPHIETNETTVAGSGFLG
jgi:hypothetical protein